MVIKAICLKHFTLHKLIATWGLNFMICLNYYSIVSTDGLNESLNHKNVGLEAISKSPFPTVQKQSKQMESIRWLSVLSLKFSLKRNLLISVGTHGSEV